VLPALTVSRQWFSFFVSQEMLSKASILICFLVVLFFEANSWFIHAWKPQHKCGQRPIVNYLIGRVVGGEPAIFGEIPWQASIQENRFFGFFKFKKCGAVIIDNKWLLTAAHCSSSWYFSDQIAIMGEHKLPKKSRDKTNNSNNQSISQYNLVQKRSVKRIIIHPDFDEHVLENDLALIELEEPVKFDVHIQPICLPFKQDNFTSKEGFVSGFGFTKYRE